MEDHAHGRPRSTAQLNAQQLLQQLQQATELLVQRVSSSTTALLSETQTPSTSSLPSTPFTLPQANPTSASQSLYSPSPCPSRTCISAFSQPTSSPSLCSPALPSTSYCQGPLRSISGVDRVQHNLSRLFSPYITPRSENAGRKKKMNKGPTPWSREFFCVADTDVTSPPTLEDTKELELNGLGKKNIWFPDNKGGYDHLYQRLCEAFPKLKNAGGFSLATSDRCRYLVEIPMPAEGYTIPYLRQDGGVKRKIVYIIPLQQSLDLYGAVIPEEQALMQLCLTCGKSIQMAHLKAHITTCQRACEEQSEFQIPPEPNTSSISEAWRDEDESLTMAIEMSLTHAERRGVSAVAETREVMELTNSEDEESEEQLEFAGAPVATVCQQPTSTEACLDLQSILQSLKDQLVETQAPIANLINANRDAILECTLRAFGRASFKPNMPISAVFIDTDETGEGAVDDGGPTRELLRLLIQELNQSKYFCGSENAKNLTLSTSALQAGEYKIVGTMLAVAVIHAGVLPCFFSERLYCLLSKTPSPPIDLDEIDDEEIKQALLRIKDSTTIEEAREAGLQASAILGILGCSTFIRSMTARDAIVEEAGRQYLEGRASQAMKQLAEGLSCMGLLEAMQQHPHLLKRVFVGGGEPLRTEDLLDLFTVHLAPQGGNRRREENRIIGYWRDWLLEVGEGSRPLTLAQILIFASGADKIPPLGFPHQPNITFLHAEEGRGVRVLPEASTCDITMRLPIHQSYTDFMEWMESGILQSPTFGVA